MSNRKMAFTILLVLLVQASAPIIPVDAASGRAVPNVSVDLTLSVGGSVTADGITTVAPGDHTAKVVVANIGLTDAEVTVTLVHKASVARTRSRRMEQSDYSSASVVLTGQLSPTVAC